MNSIQLEVEDELHPFYGVPVRVEILDYGIDPMHYQSPSDPDGSQASAGLDYLEVRAYIPALKAKWVFNPYLTNQINNADLFVNELEEYCLSNLLTEPDPPESQLPRKGTKRWGQLQGFI